MMSSLSPPECDGRGCYIKGYQKAWGLLRQRVSEYLDCHTGLCPRLPNPDTCPWIGRVKRKNITCSAAGMFQFTLHLTVILVLGTFHHWWADWVSHSEMFVYFLPPAVCPDKEPGLQPWMPGHNKDHRVEIGYGRKVLLTSSATVHSIEIHSGGKPD